MDVKRDEPNPMKNRTTVERKSARELVVTRLFDGPPHIVFEAWTKPELLKRWRARRHHGDLRGKEWQDTHGLARPLSL
jgi:uncharacterized protein YndB with AHSA1/START domain